MKRTFVLPVGFLLVSLLANSQNLQQYAGKEAVYVPEDNVTYFMDSAEEGVNAQGNFVVTFVGYAGEVPGEHEAEILNMNPSFRPKWERDKKRKAIETPRRHVECIAGGNLCVIIFKADDGGGPGTDQ